MLFHRQSMHEFSKLRCKYFSNDNKFSRIDQVDSNSSISSYSGYNGSNLIPDFENLYKASESKLEKGRSFFIQPPTSPNGEVKESLNLNTTPILPVSLPKERGIPLRM